jgi:hypothetical protein
VSFPDRQGSDLDTLIPDLSGIPQDKLAELGGPGLARAIALYLERLKQAGEPLSSFQARI